MNEKRYIWDNKEYVIDKELAKELAKDLDYLWKDFIDTNELSWGEEMQKMLERDYPAYSKSKHANQPIERPKSYEEKTGGKRKIFVLDEESED